MKKGQAPKVESKKQQEEDEEEEEEESGGPTVKTGQTKQPTQSTAQIETAASTNESNTQMDSRVIFYKNCRLFCSDLQEQFYLEFHNNPQYSIKKATMTT